MDFKKILIAGVVIGGAYWLWKRSQPKPEKATGTSNASGTQTSVTCTCYDANGIPSSSYSTQCTIGTNYAYDKARCCSGLCGSKGLSSTPRVSGKTATARI